MSKPVSKCVCVQTCVVVRGKYSRTPACTSHETVLALRMKQVYVDSSGFKPESINILKGQSVLWSWSGDEPHNIIKVTSLNHDIINIITML